MKPTLKIRENLYLEDGRVIVSYDTVVAEIVNNEIVEYGRFSRTTTKHINHIACLLGVKVQQSNLKNNNFFKYEPGVKVKADSLSQKLSNLILQNKKEGRDFLLAILAVADTARGKDKEKIQQYINSLPADKKAVNIVKGLVKLGL